jgi:hypothetical protein
MGNQRHISISKLGTKALDQLKAQGVDVDKLVKRETSGRHKYGVSDASERTYSGIVFDSKLEMSAYRWLLEHGFEFRHQEPFEIQPAFSYRGVHVRAITYVADFVILPYTGPKLVVDMKGMLTAEFKLKRKLLLYRGTHIHCIKSIKELEELLCPKPTNP